MSTRGKGLSPKQKQFVIEYLKDHDGTKAAIRAGYAEAGASTQASRLLTDARVDAFLQKRLGRLLDRQEFTADKVLQEASLIAFADVRELYDDDGNLLLPHELPSTIARAVASFKFDKGKLEYKLVQKVTALELLAKYYGLLTTKVQVQMFSPEQLKAMNPEALANLEDLSTKAVAALAVARLTT